MLCNYKYFCLVKYIVYNNKMLVINLKDILNLLIFITLKLINKIFLSNTYSKY